MSSRVHGAGAATWLRLADTFLLPDLLPVVSNASAQISAKSRMETMGKTPSWYSADGCVTGIGQWTARQTDRGEVERWAKEDDYGICIQTRRLRAIDVDVDNPMAASLIQDEVIEYLGVDLTHGQLPPVRMRSNSGKLLIPFVYEGELFKRKFTCHMGGLVELLATGQQFVAYGTHPSGVKYEWQGMPELAPVLTLEDVEELWAMLVQKFAVPDTERRGRRSTDGNGVHRPDINDPVYQYLEHTGRVIDFDDKKGHAHIVCPFEHEHSTHNLTSTTYMIRGSHGHDSGHFSCLHASCAGRTDGDFLRESGYTLAGFDDEVEDDMPAAAEAPAPSIDDLLPPPSPVGKRTRESYVANDKGDWPTFARNKNGEIEATIDNVVRALSAPQMSGVKIAFDEFLMKVVIDKGDGSMLRLTDIDYIALRIELEKRGFKPIGQEMMRHAVSFVADRHTINSAQLWLDSLKWDGTPRVRQLMRCFYKVEGDTAYTEAVGLYLMTALAGRVLYPGCKVDMVPVLTSEQGTVKTSAVEALAPNPEAFGEMDLGMSDDNIGRLLSGKVIVEMAELKGMRTEKGVEHLRTIISRRYDEWVPKYQEHPVRRPRTSVFMGTTNEFAMLIDRQGNRRWLPMVVGGQIDVARIRQERDQLWAEGAEIARKRVAEGLDPVAWEEAYKLGGVHQKEHEVVDTLKEAVIKWLNRDRVEFGDDAGEPAKNCDLPFLTRDVIDGLSAGDRHGVGKRELESRIGDILRGEGFEYVVIRVGRDVFKRWRRKLL